MNIDIRELIPQREPIILIDAFYGLENNVSLTGLTITENTLFCKEGKMDECGIIEHLAQSAAARIGYICRTQQQPIPVGYIGSVDKLTVYRLPETGEKLKTFIEIIQEVGNITLITATVFIEEEIITKGQLKIFLKKDI